MGTNSPMLSSFGDQIKGPDQDHKTRRRVQDVGDNPMTNLPMDGSDAPGHTDRSWRTERSFIEDKDSRLRFLVAIEHDSGEETHINTETSQPRNVTRLQRLMRAAPQSRKNKGAPQEEFVFAFAGDGVCG